MKSLFIRISFLKKYFFLSLAIFLLCLPLIFFYKIKPDTSLIHLIPNDTILKKQYEFIEARNAKFDIIIELTTQDNKPKETLKHAIDVMTSNLKKLELENVISHFVDNQSNDISDIINYYPMIFSKESEAALLKLITKASLSKIFSQHLEKLKSGIGFFYKQMIVNDPLNLSTKIFKEMQHLSKNIGLNAYIENGYIFHKDHKKALILIKSGQKENLNKLKEILNNINDMRILLDKKINMNIISMHFHSIYNESILKQDIKRSMLLVSIILFLLLLFIFKDLKAVFIFIIPIIAMLPSIFIMKFFYKDISAIALGFGSVIAGISIDYGIHIFSALKSNIENPYNEIKKPLFISLITTVISFGVFSFSTVLAFKQIAFFTITCLIFCFIATLYFLPMLIKSNKQLKVKKEFNFKIKKPILIAWLIIFIVSMIYSLKTDIKTDIKQYDGTPNEILSKEDCFLKNWQTKDYMAIVAEGNTLENTLIKNDQVYNVCLDSSLCIKSISSLLPSTKMRKLNIQRWNSFLEINGKEFMEQLSKVKIENGFSENSFSTFYKKIDNGLINFIPSSILALSENFIFQSNNNFYITTLLPENYKFNDQINNLINNDPNLFLFSKNEFIQKLTVKTQSEIITLTIVACLACFLVLFILLHNFKKVLIALIPALSAIFIILGGFNYFGINITPLNIIALIIVTGLSIDYAVFIIHYYSERKQSGIIKGVLLSGVTTLSGAFILSLTKHPLLFQLGITIFIGILISILTTFFILPYFMTTFFKLEKG